MPNTASEARDRAEEAVAEAEDRGLGEFVREDGKTSEPRFDADLLCHGLELPHRLGRRVRKLLETKHDAADHHEADGEVQRLRQELEEARERIAELEATPEPVEAAEAIREDGIGAVVVRNTGTGHIDADLIALKYGLSNRDARKTKKLLMKQLESSDV